MGHRYRGAHGEIAETAALRKVVKALALQKGEFGDSEVWLFRTETLTLVAALADARMEGLYPRLESCQCLFRLLEQLQCVLTGDFVVIDDLLRSAISQMFTEVEHSQPKKLIARIESMRKEKESA